MTQCDDDFPKVVAVFERDLYLEVERRKENEGTIRKE
jgi:hypothetical protein